MTNRQTARAFNPFVDEILKHSSIRAATHATSFPGAEIGWHRTDIKLQSEDSEHRYNSRIIAVGYNFLETFGLPLTAGRNFDPSIENDQRSMLLNEEACKMFGFQQSADALGKYVFIGSKKCEVIGVVKNYHYVSLQNKLQPILYFPGSTTNPKYAVKISGENISTTIAFLEKEWKRAYAGNVFRYYFLDDFFDHQYTTDRKLGLLVGSITSIAIIISCLGLFGLSLYAVLRRTKEIGIRKVLGASVHDVVILLSNDLGKIIIAGSVIGVPLAYYIVQLWLQRYTYKIPVDLWLFIIPLLSIIILATVTISYQTVRAARKNPVDSLKYE
jgi:putative ABC transport system permease protein